MTEEARSGVRRGILVLIGGSEDKKNDKVVLKRVVEANGAGHVTVIPTASSYPKQLGMKYIQAFGALGVKTVSVLDIRRRPEASLSGHLETVAKTDVVFFTGGDQIRLVDVLDGTPLMELVRKRHSEGITVAGTSAGAAAAGEITIYEGNDEGYRKGTVLHARGFGFLKGITVDTHFLQRRRISRLTQHMASGLCSYGIGLAEDTAVAITPDATLEVVGSGIVTVLNGDTILSSNYEEIKKYDTITVEGIQMSYLSSGTLFNMETWKVMPVEIPEREGRGERTGLLSAVSRLLS